jgi:hypothetical protein
MKSGVLPFGIEARAIANLEAEIYSLIIKTYLGSSFELVLLLIQIFNRRHTIQLPQSYFAYSCAVITLGNHFESGG